jgi:hypothetical protein
MLCTDPVKQSKSPTAETEEQETRARERRDGEQGASATKLPVDDLEGAYQLDTIDPETASTETLSRSGLTFSHIVNHIWHFCSVDYGPKCECEEDGMSSQLLIKCRYLCWL